MWHFRFPESPECRKQVLQVAKENLRTFEGSEAKRTKSFLMEYPVAVGRQWKLGPRVGWENVKDTNAKMMGARSMVLPLSLTT